AVRWYRMAAIQQHSEAFYRLCLLSDAGRGVPKDSVQAHQWYNLAGAYGNEDGVKRRNRLAQNMTPGQIAQAQYQARSWRGKYQDPSQRMQLDQQVPPR
ncbi:MAG: sel1 repeat family protein, partial [Nitrospira sp.]|nr:sel1 repeat family protein [Nitrospira sp.]